MVLKQLASDLEGNALPQRAALSVNLGLAREGLFYKHVAGQLGELVPKVVYAHGDMVTGHKCVIMEDLSDYVDSGALFGPGNPNNWKRTLSTYEERAGHPKVDTVVSITFRAYARVHAKYWRSQELLEKHWLRGALWVSGKSQDSWAASQEYARSQWEIGKAGRARSLFHPLVFEALEKAVQGISWDAQVQRLNAGSSWTLVHGDCWPGNVMWHRSGHVKLVDWEMCGIGSAAQDLGQYVISNMEPSARRECEHRVVREYYDELVAAGVENYSFEECWREYQVGGTERWLWFLCYFAGTDAMFEWTRFFHDQVLAFMQDHKLSAADITQVRA